MTLRSLLPAGLLLVASWASAASPPTELVQPAEGRRGLVLATAPGSAHIEHPDGRRHRIPLRRHERLTELLEARDGWIAAGVRDTSVLQKLVLLAEEHGHIRRLPVPPRQRTLLRLRPILLGERGRLVGMAWLEGDDFAALTVHAAAWDGADWSPPTRVTAAEAGNQTGLTGLVLANGSWLLVWSQFDGHDDELYWSVRRDATWSEPRLLDLNNRVPDITPHLVRQPGGALLAWSRYDGSGYRLLLARFHGGRWEAPEPVGGHGTVYPRFTRRYDQIYLLYRTAWPPDWTVAKVAGDGHRLLGHAVFPDSPPERPVLRAAGPQGVTLIWPSLRRGIEGSWGALP